MKNLSAYIFRSSMSRPFGYNDFEECLSVRVILISESSCIAEAQFLINHKDKTVKPLEIGVNEDHRRRGIATNMYILAEAKTGYKMIPSDDASVDAESFWKQPNRPFG